jgi:peptidyl-prolyl cis-trans isomerase C/foldase protein PrsA
MPVAGGRPGGLRAAVPAGVLIACTLAGACHRPAPGPPAVAFVGSDRILAPELAAELERVRVESEAEVKLDGEKLAAVRRGVLDELVDRKLLLAEAVRAGITVSDKEIEQALALRQGAVLPGAPTRESLSPEQLRIRTRDQLLIDRFLLREVAARVAVGPDDAQNYYNAHPDEFRRSEQVRVSQILIDRKGPSDVDAMQQAQALRAEIGRGGDFARLAREHSSAPEARLGGDLGWFGHGSMPPEIEKACFALKRGQISEVVESPYGLHIFKLVDRRDAAQIPFAEAERSIEQKLQRAAVEKAETSFLEKLRQKVGVRVVEAEVQKVM